jgi:DNA-binding CsgD family transcriptional regulator
MPEFALTGPKRATVPMIDAFHTAAVGTRDEIARALEERGRSSAAGRLLDAVLAQYDGDVDAAIRQLRSLVASGGAEGSYAADVLAPILMMRSGHESEIAALAETLGSNGWPASAAVFRAHIAAHEGASPDARAHVERATRLLETEEDAVIRFRLEQRLARVAFYLHDYDSAMQLALRSAAGASRLAAWRAAAAGYSILYNIHADVTGDVAEADHYAGLTRIAATRSDDASFLHTALVAEFELAVQSADEPRIAVLRREIRRRLLPPQYAEHFALVFSEALLTSLTDQRAFMSVLQVLRDAGDRSRGERALCTALIGVAHAAEFDDAAARSEIREAIRILGRPRSSEPAFEKRYRRLARVAAAVTCLLVGDNVRAGRTLRTAEMAAGSGEEHLVQVARSGAIASAPRWQRAFAKLFAGAFAARRAAEPPVQLTAAELDVLRLLAAGYGAKRIARESGRSVNTVYNHTRSILAKFDAERTAEAVMIARRIGMLT